MRKFATRTGALVVVSVGSMLVMAGSALATVTSPTVDYSQVTTPVTDQITALLPEALGLLGVIAAVILGIGLFRRITGAKKASG